MGEDCKTVLSSNLTELWLVRAWTHRVFFSDSQRSNCITRWKKSFLFWFFFGWIDRFGLCVCVKCFVNFIKLSVCLSLPLLHLGLSSPSFFNFNHHHHHHHHSRSLWSDFLLLIHLTPQLSHLLTLWGLIWSAFETYQPISYSSGWSKDLNTKTIRSHPPSDSEDSRCACKLIYVLNSSPGFLIESLNSKDSINQSHPFLDYIRLLVCWPETWFLHVWSTYIASSLLIFFLSALHTVLPSTRLDFLLSKSHIGIWSSSMVSTVEASIQAHQLHHQLKLITPQAGVPDPPRPSSSSSSISSSLSSPPLQLDSLWPPCDVSIEIHPDDRSDQLLMAICAALVSVDNRALCPKEIADVVFKNHWAIPPWVIFSWLLLSAFHFPPLLPSHPSSYLHRQAFWTPPFHIYISYIYLNYIIPSLHTSLALHHSSADRISTFVNESNSRLFASAWSVLKLFFRQCVCFFFHSSFHMAYITSPQTHPQTPKPLGLYDRVLYHSSLLSGILSQLCFPKQTASAPQTSSLSLSLPYGTIPLLEYCIPSRPFVSSHHMSLFSSFAGQSPWLDSTLSSTAPLLSFTLSLLSHPFHLLLLCLVQL